jgi:putative oxidoreductase
MLESLFAPYSDVGLLVLRIGLALVFIAHGWPKLNPNSPMKGTAGVAGFFKQLGIPLPTAAAWLVALLETIGSVLLILGLGTRILAIMFVINMLVAIVKARIGMMKSSFAGGNAIGWEFEFLLAVGALALLFTGAGAYSLDAMLNTGL